jgi:hypothetical protein
VEENIESGVVRNLQQYHQTGRARRRSIFPDREHL